MYLDLRFHVNSELCISFKNYGYLCNCISRLRYLAVRYHTQIQVDISSTVNGFVKKIIIYFTLKETVHL